MFILLISTKNILMVLLGRFTLNDTMHIKYFLEYLAYGKHCINITILTLIISYRGNFIKSLYKSFLLLFQEYNDIVIFIFLENVAARIINVGFENFNKSIGKSNEGCISRDTGFS